MISGGGLSVGLVVLRSLTKFFVMPGLRVAYAVAHPETRVAIEAFVPAWPVDSIAAEAARLVLQDQASIAGTREINARERKLCCWPIRKAHRGGLCARKNLAGCTKRRLRWA